MPLMKGDSKGVIGENIRELMRTGRKQDQAVAIALHTARKTAKPKPKVVKSKDNSDHDYDD